MKPEEILQSQICRYIEMQYPKVLFETRLNGLKMPIGLAKKAKMLGARRAMPDLTIYEECTKNADGLHITKYGGLFLELKAEGTRLKNKKGEYATPHLLEQAGMLARLRMQGYYADFAVGFDQAKEIIDWYLSKE